jgi:DNA-directed RNA polymerase specialized sigma subunit
MAEEIAKKPYVASYKTWSSAPTPENASTLLNDLEPVINTGLSRFAEGPNDPIMRSHARRLTLDALRTYQPNGGAQLSTHVVNHLQGLRRISKQQNQVLHIPERAAMDQAYLHNSATELEDKLGREPSIPELADHVGFSLAKIERLRRYMPGVAEGAIGDAAEVQPLALMNPRDKSMHYAKLLHAELQPRDQKILEWTLGLYGGRQINNYEIAAKLGITPGAVSQRKSLIQRKLDELSENTGV